MQVQINFGTTEEHGAALEAWLQSARVRASRTRHAMAGEVWFASAWHHVTMAEQVGLAWLGVPQVSFPFVAQVTYGEAYDETETSTEQGFVWLPATRRLVACDLDNGRPYVPVTLDLTQDELVLQPSRSEAALQYLRAIRIAGLSLPAFG